MDIDLICQQFTPLIKKYTWMYYRKLPDAESEAWLILISAARTYTSEKGVPLAGYLESKVKYGMFNLYRKEKKRQCEVLFDSTYFNELPAGDVLQIQLEKKECFERLLMMVNKLPRKQRFVIVENVINQHKLERVASLLGITVQAVSQLKKRALARLIKLLILGEVA